MALMGRLPRACIAAGRKSPSDRKAEVYNTPFWQGNLPEGFCTSGACRQRQLHADVFPEKTAKKSAGHQPGACVLYARLHCAAREVANPEAEQR